MNKCNLLKMLALTSGRDNLLSASKYEENYNVNLLIVTFWTISNIGVGEVAPPWHGICYLSP